MTNTTRTTAQPVRSRLDRWFFTGIALLFAAAAIVGFTPNSLAILGGMKENPPLLVHLHAMAMSSWLLLLFCQASLVASGKQHLHRRLGKLSFMLAPVIVALMIALAFPLFARGTHSFSIGVIQIKRISLFSLFFLWAILARKKKPQSHKRLMLLATFVLLDAAFNRMRFLPDFGIHNRMAVGHAYELLFLLPVIYYDLKKSGHVHRVNLIGMPLIAAFSIVASVLW